MINRLFIFASLIISVAVPSAADDAPNAILNWTTGDSLPGRLQQVTGKELIWESPLFASPLRLDRSALSSIEFLIDESLPLADDTFRIALRNGDVIFGQIESLDERVLTINSVRHGTVRIARQHLSGIDRLNNEGLIFVGPAGLIGWSGHKLDTKWQVLADGTLRSEVRDAMLRHLYPTVDQLAVEIELQFDALPDFVLGLGKSEETGIRLETWEDTLVLVAGQDWHEILTYDESTKTIHLLIYVDVPQRRLIVCTPQGDTLLDSMELTATEVSGQLELRTGPSAVTLKHLQIGRWNGNSVGTLIPGKTGVQRLNGQVEYGRFESITADVVRLQTDSETLQIPLNEVGSMEIESVAADEEVEYTTASRLKWRDGGALTGELLKLDEQSGSIQTAWSEQPVGVVVSGLQLAEFPAASALPQGPDELIVDGRLLHGHLVVDSGDQPVTWKPTGGLEGVSLRSGDNAVVTRKSAAAPVDVSTTDFPDTLYLRNNDVIPCRVDSITDDLIHVSSPFMSSKEFPTDIVKALELSSVRHGSVPGFEDDSWQQIRGRAIKDGDSVALQSGRFGNATAMLSDQLTFHVRWPTDQWALLKIHVYADDVHQVTRSAQFNLLFGLNFVASVKGDDTEHFLKAVKESRVLVDGNSATVDISTTDGKLLVRVNKKMLAKLSLHQDAIDNTGVVFELTKTSTTRANLVRREPQPGRVIEELQRRNIARKRMAPGNPKVRIEPKNDETRIKHLTLSGFASGGASGSAVQYFIDEESRRLALTIPRFRRDDPSTHALIAPNGDILRGRLIAIDEDVIEFESRLERFRFERERISAVVWIQNPDTAPNDPKSKVVPKQSVTELQTVLSGGLMVSMTPVALRDGSLQGHSSVLGECQVPAAAISRLYLGDPEQREHTAAYSQWKARHAQEPDWQIAQSNNANPAATAMIGQKAPAFELPQLDGKTFRLGEQTGKVVVLDFWASWCGPCVAALPKYAEALKMFDGSQVEFVAVNVEESPQQVRRFLEEYEIDVRVAVDSDSGVAEQYNVDGIPHSVVIDPQGIIRHVQVGYEVDGSEQLQEAVRGILDGDAVDEPTPIQNDAE